MSMKVLPDSSDRRQGWQVPQALRRFAGEMRFVVSGVLLVGGALSVFIVIDNPWNRFTRLEGEMASNKIQQDAKVDTLRQTMLTYDSEQDSVRKMVETLLILECLRPDRRSDLQKGQAPCARLFNQRGIDAR